MKIAVVGASGTLGRSVVRAASAAGHEVTAVVRSGLPTPTSGVTVRHADVVSRAGLHDALAGVEIVIDVVNSPKPSLLAVGTHAILDAATELRVRHYVGISVVGCDKVPHRYYRGKVEQEKVVAASPIPWSLLRATQFHDFLDDMFSTNAALGIYVVPSSMVVQPVSVDEVAAALLAAAVAAPAGLLPDFAGPEMMRMATAFRVWRQTRRRRGIALPMPMVGAVGRALKQGGLCNAARAVGHLTFSEWLQLACAATT